MEEAQALNTELVLVNLMGDNKAVYDSQMLYISALRDMGYGVAQRNVMFDNNGICWALYWLEKPGVNLETTEVNVSCNCAGGALVPPRSSLRPATASARSAAILSR